MKFGCGTSRSRHLIAILAALVILNGAAESFGRDARGAASYVRRARRAEQQGDHDRATDDLNQAGKLDPKAKGATHEINDNLYGPTDSYYTEVAAVVGAAWYPPPRLHKRSDLEAKVIITINRQGHIIRTEIVDLSSEPDFNTSVKLLLEHLEILPPPPHDWSGEAIELPFLFTPAED